MPVRVWVTVAAALPAAAAVAAAGPAAAADGGIELPRPMDDVPVLAGVGLPPDRLLVSRTPGPVANREAITAAMDMSGVPVTVTVEQRLSITRHR